MAAKSRGPLPETLIVAAALRGMARAQRDYDKWNGDWLWRAPEYFSTVYIAQAIGARIGGEFLTLENGAEAAVRDAGARGRGRLHHQMRPKGRMDILLWWARRTPRVVIEVKVQVNSFKKISADANRIAKMLLRTPDRNSLCAGMIMFYASCRCRNSKPENKLSERIKNIHDAAKDEFAGKCRVYCQKTSIVTEGDSAWAAVALRFKRMA